MKRVLIIIYYWPPTGGSGVQRWVKFVKHLRSFGWEPVIYTPEEPFVQELDKSFLKEIPEGVEILRQPVFEIQKYFGGVVASSANAANKPGYFSAIKKAVGNFIRGNFFIPDARVTWIKPSVKFLSGYLAKQPVDVIVSSGPPHSMHLIAQQLKSKFNIPWLADFRDPWIEILDFHGFKTSSLAKAKHQKLFHGVLADADAVVVAHNTVRDNFQKLTKTRVTAITNGYDEDDFKADVELNLSDAKFKIVFVGILYDVLNSSCLWKALRELVNENKDFGEKLQLIFVGKIHEAAMSDIRENGLLAYSVFTGYVDHAEAIAYERAADLLLLLTPADSYLKYVIPGKLFEYMASGKPILCTAQPDNDSAKILLASKAGIVVHPNDFQAIKQALKSSTDMYPNRPEVEKYERKKLTEQLVQELNRISGF
ncbi:MAG: glycosyltransferase family 4 protein [Bacteroidetes bacterium]|nr:glycosyltransferase family 4 protein [Bacteroidota bacterium]